MILVFSYFSALSFEADLAVIELAQRITFDDYKQPVALGMLSNYKSIVTIFELSSRTRKLNRKSSQ